MNANECKTDIRTIHSFLCSAQGNWRNSIYVDCSICKFNKESQCGNFLFVPAYNGSPILLPVSDAEILTGHPIDKSECLGVISNLKFHELFSLWFKLNIDSDEPCPFLQAAKRPHHD